MKKKGNVKTNARWFYQISPKRRIYENISIDDLLKEINQLGFQYTEQDILDKYQEYMSVTDTDDYFFKKDQMSWEAVDDKAQILNSDALLQLICKIVKKHYDIEKYAIHGLLWRESMCWMTFQKMKHKKKY